MSNLEREEHSHNCCGMEFIMDFRSVEARDEEKALKALGSIASRIEEDFDPDEAEDCGAEDAERAALCVLTDNQLLDWAPIMKEAGFRTILRWKNPDSGNYCNLMTRAEHDTAGIIKI